MTPDQVQTLVDALMLAVGVLLANIVASTWRG